MCKVLKLRKKLRNTGHTMALMWDDVKLLLFPLLITKTGFDVISCAFTP